MNLDLENRTAIVTGASRGIGLAVTRELTREGAHVIAAARHPGEELREIANVTAVAVDLTDPDGAEELVAKAEHLDILVNNLGGLVEQSVAAGGFVDITDDSWQQTYELNLFATVRVIRHALPKLIARHGVIINVSSIGARAAFPPVDYGTAKAALSNLTKALAEEYGSQGVRALTVSPGPTRTANWLDPDGPAGRAAATQGISLDEFLSRIPKAIGLTIGRLSEPEETARLITFLASPRVANLTGADYLADGGAIKTI